MPDINDFTIGERLTFTLVNDSGEVPVTGYLIFTASEMQKLFSNAAFQYATSLEGAVALAQLGVEKDKEDKFILLPVKHVQAVFSAQVKDFPKPILSVAQRKI